MCRKNCAVFCVGCFYENVTFNVCANGIIFVEVCFCAVCELNVYRNIDCLACCNFNRCKCEVLEKELCVVGSDLAVAVYVSSLFVK